MRQLLFLCLCWSALVCANGPELTLKLPAFNDETHRYYYELLQQSLALEGVKLTIEQPYKHVPQKRGKSHGPK